MQRIQIRTLLLISWVIIALLGLFSFTSNAKAAASFELTYAGQPGPLFNETNLAPLDSVTRQITVKNLTSDTQKFALNLQDLLGAPDEKLAAVLTAEISHEGILLYSSKLSALKDTETFLENIPAGQSYIYDIRVTMDDVGNDYQGQMVKFDLVFGWLEETISGGGGGTKGLKGVLGASIGPAITELPEAGYNAISSIFIAFMLLFAISIINQIVLKYKN